MIRLYIQGPIDKSENTKSLCRLLKEVHTRKPSHLLITGDFYLPKIDWEHVHSHADNHSIQTFVNTFNISRVVPLSTHHTMHRTKMT